MNKSDRDMELKAWYLLLEDDTYRLEFPEDYYRTLLKRADELMGREVIDLPQWQRLKDAADAMYHKTGDCHERSSTRR